MTPKKLALKPGDRGQARARRIVAEKYLEVAELIEQEDGAMVNVCVGLCVLSGVAASDAITMSANGMRYSGTDHGAAADYLAGVDKENGKRLSRLVALKPPSHYGGKLLTEADRRSALRDASALVEAARRRTT